MVKITRITTKTGDDGSTGLGDGSRVSKSDLRVGVCGDVDEANAAIGVAITQCPAESRGTPVGRIRTVLESVQQDLFDVGADLTVPVRGGDTGVLRIVPAQTDRLETLTDEFNKPLPALESFVLPGGSLLAASLHLARTVVRRAERSAVTLAQSEPEATSPEVIRYLNRLSDLLFVLARVANAGSGAWGQGRTGDVLWDAGRNRPTES